MGTPEALSGADVFLAQVVVIPRNTDQADVRGNLQDEGRRTVASTRGRKLLSYHMEENCFAAVGGNYCWHDHWTIVRNKNWKGRFKRQDRIVDANYTEQPAAAYLDDFLIDDGADTEAGAEGVIWMNSGLSSWLRPLWSSCSKAMHSHWPDSIHVMKPPASKYVLSAAYPDSSRRHMQYG